MVIRGKVSNNQLKTASSSRAVNYWSEMEWFQGGSILIQYNSRLGRLVLRRLHYILLERSNLRRSIFESRAPQSVVRNSEILPQGGSDAKSDLTSGEGGGCKITQCFQYTNVAVCIAHCARHDIAMPIAM